MGINVIRSQELTPEAFRSSRKKAGNIFAVADSGIAGAVEGWGGSFTQAGCNQYSQPNEHGKTPGNGPG
jgi:hypothetical protein